MTALTKADLMSNLSKDLGLNKREAKEMVDVFFFTLSDALEHGINVRISGFGNFILRDKAERPGRNPKTGEVIPIPARRVVTFAPGQKLRNSVEKYIGPGMEGYTDPEAESDD